MTQPFATVGVAHRPLPGETESGDRCVVRLNMKRALIGVIDGVGHGPNAARVALSAADVIEEHSAEQPISILRRCHAQLRGTRGAAITVLAYDPAIKELEWVGTGNVGAALFRRERWGFIVRKDLPVRGGIVGMSLPLARTSSIVVRNGDFLVVATDGMKRDFLECVPNIWKALSAQEMADSLLEECHAGIDDALVLVVMFKTAMK